MCELNAKFDADFLFYSLRHFECDGHTVHMLTQQHLPPPPTSTVKSSVFTHVPSSPLSLTARLHRSHTNHSHYSNNGWTFSGQISDICDMILYIMYNISHQSTEMRKCYMVKGHRGNISFHCHSNITQLKVIP